MTTPPCRCGQQATGLVVEGHLHPYCAWQAERARAEGLREALEDHADYLDELALRPTYHPVLHHQQIDNIRAGMRDALAADREGRAS